MLVLILDCTSLKENGYSQKRTWFMQISCDSLALELFFSPTPRDDHDPPIRTFIYYNLYKLDQKLQSYIVLFSEFGNT
jgi:hypothetical protein